MCWPVSGAALVWLVWLVRRGQPWGEDELGKVGWVPLNGLGFLQPTAHSLYEEPAENSTSVRKL